MIQSQTQPVGSSNGSEAHIDDEDSKEAHDGSEEASQSIRTFNYKSSHSEELIIGIKDSPLKTISTFKKESMLGLRDDRSSYVILITFFHYISVGSTSRTEEY